jgi:hypothetical protein
VRLQARVHSGERTGWSAADAPAPVSNRAVPPPQRAGSSWKAAVAARQGAATPAYEAGWFAIGLALLVRMQSSMKKPRTGKACQDQGLLSPSPETLSEHRRLKMSSWKHLRITRWLVILSSPLIYACVLPFLLLDASVAIYQLVCFPIYGIPRVRRKDYLVFDRGRLAYLNTIERAGCVYCSYANGLLALITEIAARSEQYFCPIKHSHPLARMHSRYAKFLPYGDAQAYKGRSDAVARAYDDLSARVK